VLRSQTAILFGSIVLMLFTRRTGGHAWSRALGWWMILSVLNLHTIGASFCRTMLLDRGITTWKRRLMILLLIAGVVVGVGFWARQTVPALQVTPLDDFPAFKNYVLQVLGTGPARIILFPWRLVVRPYLAIDLHALSLALGPAFGVLALHYLWVIRSNVAFEEASIEASTKMANRVAAIRAGNWRGTTRKFKPKRPPFVLGPTGPVFVGFVWKNLISAGQGFAPRLWLVIAISTGAMCLGLRGSASTAGWQPMIGLIAMMLMLWTVLLGPQFMRQDFRQDLQQVDLLKSYPMRGWQIALGEILGPALVLAAIQWLLLILAVGLLSPDLLHGLVFTRRLLLGLGVAVVLPMLDLVVLQIPNAAVLLFPAWFQPGKAAPQGIEVTGQRIILMLGSLLVFVLSLIPSGGVFVGIFFLSGLVMSPYAAVPVASLAAAIVLAAEAAGGILLLGKIFERFDSSAELSA
jgi:ABC-2 type transport system permease protein